MQTFTPQQWMKIAVANSYGLDKLVFENRLNWFDTQSNAILNKTETLIDVAEEPMMFRKMVHHYKQVLAGKPTGCLVGLDSTSSGVQILSALTACYKGCVRTNLINDGKRHDLYGEASEFMNSLGLETTRSQLKQPLMTYFYGSTEQPKMLFGDGTPALRDFYKFLKTELKGAYEAMNDMASVWNPEALLHKWRLPDGHLAYVPVMVPVDKRIEIDELDHVTFTQRVYVNQPSDYGRSIMANITHSIDGYVVREMVRMAHAQGFKILTIHDSFWCSPLHVNKMRRNYNVILSELCRQDVLSNILSQLLGKEVEIEPIDNRQEIADLILEANYSIN